MVNNKDSLSDFENNCISLILKSQIDKAYKAVADFRSKDKYGGGGMGFDWSEEKEKGIDPEAFEMYQSFLQNQSDQERIPRAVLVFCDMMGNPRKTKQILKKWKSKITNEALDEIFCDLHKYLELRHIAEYKRDGLEEYEVLGCDDDSACDLCRKMNGKVFKVSEAKPRVNLPPFCIRCRCTTVPHLPY